jgi:hypothetical protein
MKPPPVRFQGVVAAGLMAILTLSVFASTAYSGPESTIFRFHEAVMDGDLEGVRGAFLQDPTVPPASDLVADVQLLLVQGAQIRVLMPAHQGRSATADVLYFRQGVGVFSVRYHLKKPTDRWLIDAAATWQGAVRARMGGR